MGAATMAGFTEARRELGLTGSVEKRILLRLAARVPARVHSDHLTALGFAATLSAGLLYAGSLHFPWMVLAVNAALVLNWLGDSLDGTLARFRNRSRPRYGFYLDHLVDSIGAVALMLGLAWSGLMAPIVAGALLAAYLLVSIETYLATYTVGSFKLAHGGVGGTELRIALLALNVAAWAWPAGVMGVRVFDAAGAAAALGLAGVLVRSAVRNSRRLAGEEAFKEPTRTTRSRSR